LSSSDNNDRSKIFVLHPPPYRVQGNDNANSLVLRIDADGQSLVLPGDLEPPGLEMVLNRSRPLPGGVLMAPHHGSLTVDSQAILDWARPGQVIVSGGERAKRPEVAEALRVRGSDVFVTAEIGAIQVTLTAGTSGDSSKPSLGRQSQSAQPVRTQAAIRAWLIDPW
jgi:competence protein ComEC